MRVLVLLLFVAIAFARVFVVYSYSPSGYPKEEVAGGVYVQGVFSDSDSAMFLAQELQARSGIKVYVASLPDRSDWKRYMEVKNLAYLRSCSLDALEMSLPADFSRESFLKDVRGLISAIEREGVKERVPCGVRSLDEYLDVLNSFRLYESKLPALREIIINLQGWKRWKEEKKRESGRK